MAGQKNVVLWWTRAGGVSAPSSARTFSRPDLVLPCQVASPQSLTKSFVSVRNTGYVTTTTVCELLQKLAEQSLGLPITLLLDNARYQKCALVQSLEESLWITLLYLPSYSPNLNLNLIERLWKFVKKTSLNSRSYDTFAEFQVAIDHCLDELFTTHSAAVSALLNPKLQTFENASILAA